MSARKRRALSSFNRKAGRKDGLQGKCRACSKVLSKQHYRSNTGYYIAKARKRRSVTLALVRRLKNKPCADCGHKFHFSAMDFDHLEDHVKTGSIASLARRSGWSYERLLSEVAKCDLVCANCHRVRTYNRQKRRRRKNSYSGIV